MSDGSLDYLRAVCKAMEEDTYSSIAEISALAAEYPDDYRGLNCAGLVVGTATVDPWRMVFYITVEGCSDLELMDQISEEVHAKLTARGFSLRRDDIAVIGHRLL